MSAQLLCFPPPRSGAGVPSSSRPGEGQQAALSSGLRRVLFQGRVPPASPLHPEWKYLGETGPLNSPCPSPQLSRSSTRSCFSPVPQQARSPQTRQTVSMNQKKKKKPKNNRTKQTNKKHKQTNKQNPNNFFPVKRPFSEDPKPVLCCQVYHPSLDLPIAFCPSCFLKCSNE